MPTPINTTPAGKAALQRRVDHYEAAVRLERIRQQVREASRYGFTVTRTMRDEVSAAEKEYTVASLVVAIAER